MHPVVHFEMPAQDTGRMARFYAGAFGWSTRDLGAEMGGYVLAVTAETDENGRPKQPGMINGGFYPKKEGWPAQYPSVVIAVADIKESMTRVAENGGEILGEPMEIPGIGLYVSFYDTESNRVSMLQPVTMAAQVDFDKKKAAQDFLSMVVARDIEAAYEKYVHPDFRHHNPYFPGDRESLLTAMLESHGGCPEMTLEIQRVLEDGDLVAVHSRIKPGPNRVMAVVHIFRFQGRHIVEFWDIGQEIFRDSPNEHGAF
jgi:predicted enzyme related to lactoylglutathione lyase/predicted SnoaL-like aldol condensation-catalyzing enzyme